MDVCCHRHRILLLYCFPDKKENGFPTLKLAAPVNPIVDQDHTSHRQPEGEEGGEDGVRDVRGENTFRDIAHLLDVRLT